MITNQSNQPGRAHRSGTPADRALTGAAVTGTAVTQAAVTGTASAGDPAAGRAPRRRERVATVSLVVGLGAALAAVTLSGCGIRSTAVPVDAGLPASRTACPPSPQASTSSPPFSGGPAALPSPGTGNALSGAASPLASESPWEALTSTLSGLATSAASGTTSRPAASASASARAQHGSAVPSPHVSASARAAATTAPVPSRSAKSGFSTASCGGPATGAP